jgi:hypothetical protein
MNEETQKNLFNLLYSLEDLHNYDETKIGAKIGAIINQLQEQLLNTH